VTLEDLGYFLVNARVVDLSKKVSPGKAAGPFDTGARLYQIEPFVYPPGELMHRISMESHISTHVEAPMHYVKPRYHREAKDISELPLSAFFGVAVLVDCRDLAPRTPIGRETIERFPILEGDIVLFGNSPNSPDERCYLAKEAAQYLVRKRIKMAGIDDTVYGENPEYRLKVFEKYHTHDMLLSNDIPLIEGLANLGEIKAERFFFMAIPAKMGGLESFPVRAVAVVPGNA
jgi:arylformamidase